MADINIIYMKTLTQYLFESIKKLPSGKTGIVVKDINNIEGKGQVKVNGELWSAFSSDSREIIKENSPVVIEGLEGVKLKVKKSL